MLKLKVFTYDRYAKMNRQGIVIWKVGVQKVETIVNKWIQIRVNKTYFKNFGA